MSEPAGRRWSPSGFVKASIGLHLTAGAFVAIDPSHWSELLTLVAVNHVAIGVASMSPRSRQVV